MFGNPTFSCREYIEVPLGMSRLQDVRRMSPDWR
ncbi:hypothetical protein PhCBS80983_g05505 [Powellomyces hirtus]|uniref:Uncharacterized protein n=1 Tax=Powellomyces hirtus TaxID=109895 RepID=A0A507DWI4_9FUNG|nr:hypothetical protein PhCBS80983_g05505 [Powellomyces hirtus]